MCVALLFSREKHEWGWSAHLHSTNSQQRLASSCLNKWTNTFKGIKICLQVSNKLIYLFILMPLSENSPFSALVSQRKDRLAFLCQSFSVWWLKEQAEKEEWEGPRPRGRLDLANPSFSAAPASPALIPTSGRALPPLGWQGSHGSRAAGQLGEQHPPAARQRPRLDT